MIIESTCPATVSGASEVLMSTNPLPSHLAEMPKEGTKVPLKGLVRSFTRLTIEKAIGAALHDATFKEYETRPVIVAQANY